MSALRFYTFVNFYLSPIQQGIQSFHVCHEMFNKYGMGDIATHEQFLRLHSWSKNHKTLITLNGGANEDIMAKYVTLCDLSAKLKFPMPFECFYEDAKSLGGIMTACGCVLPEEIYNAVDYRAACKILGNGFMVNLDPMCFDGESSYFFIDDTETVKHAFTAGSPEHDLITMLKSCLLAR